eukprot:PITA_06891
MTLVSKCVVIEPSSFEEVVEDHAWVDAMVEEYDSIVRNSAWEIVPRPEGKSVVGLRWIYNVKQEADGSVEKYKARFVARGFSQIKGIDYEETFALVARYSSIRMILALSTQMGWHIHQMDVKTTFLSGVIEEEVYVEQPEGFETFSNESHVCRLKRASYGLKQAPHAWYKWIDHYFLGLEIWQRSDGLFVSQGKYAREILEKFNMHGCKPVDTPLPGGWRKEDATSAEVVDATVYRQLVGSLMYLVNTRTDICYAVNQLSQAMVKPTKLFWKAGKHVLRYLRGTLGYGLCRKQRSVALNSADTEYMAASLAACEAIWMRKILVGLFKSHIDIRYHHIRGCVQQRIMLVSYIPTEDQDVDILTKALTRSKFEYHRGRIGVADNPYLVEREC